MIGHVIKEVGNRCLSAGNQNTIRRNLLIYVRFTGRAWSQFAKVKIVLYQRNHTGNQQPLCSLTEAIRLQTSRTKQNIHPFILSKGFSSILYLIHIYMWHLNRCQFTNAERLSIFLIFLDKFILHLQDTPDTATEQSIIVLYIIRVN